VLVAAGIAGCGTTTVASESTEHAIDVVHKPGHPTRIELSAEAGRRLGIQTGRVRSLAGRGAGARSARTREALPYAALLYAADGHTFTFTSPTRRTYVPRPVRVAYVAHKRAYVTAGPAPGTAVVTQGADELWGAESGVEQG
jgi:hypothetical protein